MAAWWGLREGQGWASDLRFPMTGPGEGNREPACSPLGDGAAVTLSHPWKIVLTDLHGHRAAAVPAAAPKPTRFPGGAAVQDARRSFTPWLTVGALTAVSPSMGSPRQASGEATAGAMPSVTPEPLPDHCHMWRLPHYNSESLCPCLECMETSLKVGGPLRELRSTWVGLADRSSGGT